MAEIGICEVDFHSIPAAAVRRRDRKNAANCPTWPEGQGFWAVAYRGAVGVAGDNCALRLQHFFLIISHPIVFFSTERKIEINYSFLMKRKQFFNYLIILNLRPFFNSNLFNIYILLYPLASESAIVLNRIFLNNFWTKKLNYF